MGISASRVIRIVLALNSVALVGFAVALFGQPRITALKVCMRYTELDRAGVINNDALQKTYPDLAVNPRGLVARYIGGPALRAQQVNALLGLSLAIVNLALAVGLVVAARRSACANAEPSPDQR